MRHTIILALLFFCSSCYAQNFEWAVNYDGTNTVTPSKIFTSTNGNIISCGNFRSTVDLDPSSNTDSHTSLGSADSYVQCLDSQGNFLWGKTIESTGYNTANSITSDANGNIYITGSFSDPADFDPGPAVYNLTPIGTTDSYILKLDVNGNFVWAHNFGYLNTARGMDIATDNNMDVYLTGSFSNTVDFDPGPGLANLISQGFHDVFILKLDTNGNYLWAQSFGGTNFDDANNIAISNTAIYLSGDFGATVDFDPGPGVFNLTAASTNFLDFFIIKLDHNGNFLWATKTGGNSGNEDPYGLALDDFENIYSTGKFFGTVDFDPGSGVYNLSSNGSSDIFIQKLDGQGNFVWAKNFGSFETEQGNGIAVSGDGYVYTTGGFRNTVDFDPGSQVYNLTSVGFSDAFILKLDLNGTFQDVFHYGSSIRSDSGIDVYVDQNNFLHATGSFYETIDFDPGIGVFNMTSQGSTNDAYIVKFGACQQNTNLVSPTDDYQSGDVQEIAAGQVISATNSIASGADIIYNAANCILLDEGFEVQQGAIFETKLIGCN